MKSAIILDLDGVICDTAHFHFLAWHRLAAEYGYELTHADNEQLKGVSRADSLTFILGLANKTLSPEQFQEDLHRKNEWYLELVKDMGPLDVLPGVPSFFAEVAARKIPLALGSASKNANMVLTRVGLIHAFNAIVDASQVTHGKPHPETFLKAADLLGIAPEKCLVFEDSAAGVQAAIAGGMNAIGIGTPEDLPGAIMHLRNLGEFDFSKFPL
ncbi:MAG: beta-phosphoglucomutase [Bacteroidetes bacterium]|jgi:beta-phosphoglucomutase|nr:beta-phosphoglucomutase [Bacteroidota bacterium]